METVPRVIEQRRIGVFGGIVVGVVSCLSSPGVTALALCLVADVELSFFRHSVGGPNPAVLQGWGDILRFFGMLSHPAAVLIAVVVSFLPITKRAKWIAWLVALAGILSWVIAGWLIASS